MNINIIGKTFKFDYGDSAYAIFIKSDTILHWKLIKGEYEGIHEDDETYYLSHIADNIIFLSWVEASGLGLYNILNFNTNELTTHARESKETFINKGTVKET